MSLREMTYDSPDHADAGANQHPIASAISTSDDVVAGLRAAIVESSDDAIVSTTLDGVITSWNPAAAQKFGYAEPEAIGRHITLIIPAEHCAEEDSALARVAKGENIEHLETVRRTKDGQPVEVLVTVSPIRDPAGHVIGASRVARDVTEQRRVE